MKDALISRDELRELHPVLQGKYGDRLIDFGIKISALHVPNEIYNRSKHLTGPAFCKVWETSMISSAFPTANPSG